MAYLQNYFNNLLKNIEPDTEYKKDAQTAWTDLANHLKSEDCDFCEYINKTILYGSYKRYTAIHEINDVDICILTNLDHNSEENTPKKVLRRLKKSISNYYKEVEGYDENNTEYSRKSILVKNALPNKQDSNLTLDLIPAIEQENSDYFLVPDRELEVWVETNIEGHIIASSKKNEEQNGTFKPFVKIFKHWKKHNLNSKHPKGFWLESLLIEEFEYNNSYAESFDTTLQKLLDRFAGYEDFIEVPSMVDPGMPEVILKSNMSLQEFQTFMSKIAQHKEKSSEALVSDENTAKETWRSIFGDHFINQMKLDESTQLIRQESFNNIETISKYEQFITDTYQIQRIHYKRISIFCRKKDKVYTNQTTLSSKIFKQVICKVGEEIEFDFERQNIPLGTKILWKVKNCGESAQKAGCLRGEINNFTRINTNVETAFYIGIHIVECYAIYENKVITFDRFKVIVR